MHKCHIHSPFQLAYISRKLCCFFSTHIYMHTYVHQMQRMHTNEKCIKIIRTEWNLKIWSVFHIICRLVDKKMSIIIIKSQSINLIFIIDSDKKLLVICYIIHENNCLKMMDTSDNVFVMYVFSRLNGACNWMAHESINAFPCIDTIKTCIETRCFIYFLSLKKILFIYKQHCFHLKFDPSIIWDCLNQI